MFGWSATRACGVDILKNAICTTPKLALPIELEYAASCILVCSLRCCVKPHMLVYIVYMLRDCTS